ncbi:hypothetical protein [Bacteroides neonati]|uniref:hypothetical protein n=1 Tax=Bacteroides neonati TaxID=1347393 RepID=UPI0004BCD314|nr:hypothetical protein [Bacteroides neonati]
MLRGRLEIARFIERRYSKWLDYSRYHCELSGMRGEATDVLNEVMCSLWQKELWRLERLVNTKRNGYSELDFFVLRMIKLNIYSPTSPYQNKYKSALVDENVDCSILDTLPDEDEDSDDGYLIDKFRLIRDAVEDLELSPMARKVFDFRFFQDQNFSDWPGPETLKQLYEIYNAVLDMIKRKISGEYIF